jgi:hypothetical protein
MKKLLFLTSLLVATNTYALKMYTCPSENLITSCSSCKKEDIDITFKVNIENQIVIKKINNGYTTSVSNLDECKIADKNNWICKTYWSNGNLFIKNVMTEGVYSEIYYNFYGNKTVSFSCAK